MIINVEGDNNFINTYDQQYHLWIFRNNVFHPWNFKYKKDYNLIKCRGNWFIKLFLIENNSYLPKHETQCISSNARSVSVNNLIPTETRVQQRSINTGEDVISYQLWTTYVKQNLNMFKSIRYQCNAIWNTKKNYFKIYSLK